MASIYLCDDIRIFHDYSSGRKDTFGVVHNFGIVNENDFFREGKSRNVHSLKLVCFVWKSEKWLCMTY